MTKTLCAALTLALAAAPGHAAQSVPILSVVFEGNSAVEAYQLKGQLRMSREGGWYRPEILKVEIQSIERFYRDQGYLQARVDTPQVSLQEVPGKGQAAAIRVPISEGPLYTLGAISVRNATVFNAGTLVLMSPAQKGAPFSRRKLSDWREKVAEGYQSMGYIRFDAEMIERVDEANHVVDFVLECREGSPYQVGKITVIGIPAAEQADFKRHMLLGEGGVYNPEMIPLSLHFLNRMGNYKPISGPDLDIKIDDSTKTVDLVFRLVPLKKTSSLAPIGGGSAFAFTGLGPRLQEPQATIRTEVALVNVIFSALDRNNRMVSGLKAEDFLVYEDKQPQKVEFFSDLSKGTEVPLTIAFLIDTSGSVKNKLDFERETAAEFFRKILRKGKDLALIMQFDSDANLVQDFTDDADRLIRAMDGLQAGNSTCLYDAIYLAVEDKLKQETGRKVIVVITDGEDTSSKLRKESAIEGAQRSDVLIYGIGVQGDFGANFGVLKKFSEDTGGLFFSPRARLADLEAAFRAIGEDLQGQYSLAYSSTNPKRDGSFRNIEVRSKMSSIRTRARKGYYAPKAAKSSPD